MKRATNINELANNLIPGLALTRDEHEDQYVPIYDKILDALRDRMLNDRPEARTYFVAGQSGTGKTTALNFLPDDEIEKRFDVRYIYARDLLDPLDIDIIDLLLMLAFKLVEGTALEPKYYKQLDDMRRVHEGSLEKDATREKGRKASLGSKAEASVGGGFFDFIKLKAGFFANYKLDAAYREKAREIFKLRKPDLLKLLNSLIREYNAGASGRRIMFIVDDLDKLRQIDQIKSVFIENRFYYLGIECIKIIAIPVHLTSEPEITNLGLSIPQFVLSLKPNPLDPQSGDEARIKRNHGHLSSILEQRIAPGVTLVEPSAVEEAVRYSGGIVRQYMEILYYAAAEVRRYGGTILREDDVRSSWTEIKATMDRTIVSAEKIDLLNLIRRSHTPTSTHSKIFIDCLLNNQVIACSNGTVWYEVNPVIEKTVEIYVTRQEKASSGS